RPISITSWEITAAHRMTAAPGAPSSAAIFMGRPYSFTGLSRRWAASSNPSPASDQRHHQRQHHTKDDAGDHRKVEDGILPPNGDVTRQPPKSNRQLFAKCEQDPDHDK